ncbi:MAG: formylglycine-generating enzyme family protein [Planctomycetes bacterium]|nr:formylglycine-generating enzyme family protein [Planctomycetota bacterium]
MKKLALPLLLVLCTSALAVDVEMKTESWANTDEAFAQLTQRIESMNRRNLLARRGVAIGENKDISAGAIRLMFDGAAGVRCHEGRAFVNGTPSVFSFYLGEPKTITQVGLFTCNLDARANQDYEVRFANNSANPGKLPTFKKKPDLTSGDKVIGKNGGGFHSYFVAKDGGELFPGKADWVQFRIWRTYNVKAGTPAKAGNTAASATAVIEIEVLGAKDDVLVLSKEEIERRKAIREAPKKPAYEKKATWQETMVAAREAILEWECMQDKLAAPDSAMQFGSWYALGPINRGDPVAREIERQKTVDLKKQYKTKDGKPLTWQERKDLEDGTMIDLVKAFAPRKNGDRPDGRSVPIFPDSVVFLCRSMKVTAEFDRRHPYTIGIGFASAWIKILPRYRTLWPPRELKEVVPNQISWELQIKPGNYQVLARLHIPSEKMGTDQTAGQSPSFWFCPQAPINNPGAGDLRTRIRRREALFSQLKRDFPDPVSVQQITWEQADSIWIKFARRSMARKEKFLTDWNPGVPVFLVDQYKGAIEKRLAELEGEHAAATAERFKAYKDCEDIGELRRTYYSVATLQEMLKEANRTETMRLAVADQKKSFGSRYPKGDEYLARIKAFDGKAKALLSNVIANGDAALKDVLALRDELDTASKDILLANPLLGFDKLLLIKGGPGFASNWGGPNRLGREIVVLSPVKPDGKVTTIYKTANISSMDLSWDAKKILFSDGKNIQEINADGSGHRQISPKGNPFKHYDPCRLPNGKILFVSTACEQAVPCTGAPDVGNMHIMDDNGANERRLTFDQDHDWNPVVMNDGRVLYTRWEYNDTPHYFTRLLFRMNPDGSGQMEYYGSNSYWPNAMYWPRPIPGSPSEIVCIVSGHHGVPRMGELVLLDPAKGQREANGVIQRIPGRGKKVEPVIMDGLVGESWPRFAAPWPLADPETNAGAGKYFLVTCRMTPQSPWGLYLVDVFDNMTPILMGGYSNAIPLRPRPMPPVIPDRVDPKRKDAFVYLVDVYQGNGLRGYPRGSIKALRVSSTHFRYSGHGGSPIGASYEGGWDVKKIMGTVPVYEDGSAYFRVPANTPIIVQPLDAEGKAQQQMRSWFVAMPGEYLSCVGCHEKQNIGTPNADTLAMRHPVSEIKPWHGPTRGFGFEQEIQPVLDRRCVGCHNGKPRKDGKTIPDFRSKQVRGDDKGTYQGVFSASYMALHPYVRRAGYEADYHLPAPAEWEADTSPLVQRLKKGHHNVQLTAEEWDRITTWIDLNIPYAPRWRDSTRLPTKDQVERRAKYKMLFASIVDEDEKPLAMPSPAKFTKPAKMREQPKAPAKVDGWPFDAKEAARRQQTCGLKPKALDLGSGIAMKLVPIPAGKFVMGGDGSWPDEQPQSVVTIDRPFWLSEMEVTNEQYALFDAAHDSGYMDARGKDRFTRGYPVNEPKQPVIRVSWNEAMAFCRWLSKKTGTRCTLPTEAQWEYACRAGTATPFYFGKIKPGMRDVANLSDESLRRWNWGRVEQGYQDGARFSIPGGKYKPNAWGLYDMHGNVAEWCLSVYKPYPYIPSDGRDNPKATGMKVIRGGSWNDKFAYATSAFRWRYPAYHPVYNVGFRVVCAAE